MKQIISILLFVFALILFPFNQPSQAQVGISDLADVQVCSTDYCSVRLTQSKAFYIGWELRLDCWTGFGWETEYYYGTGVYSGSLCNGAILTKVNYD